MRTTLLEIARAPGDMPFKKLPNELIDLVLTHLANGLMDRFKAEKYRDTLMKERSAMINGHYVHYRVQHVRALNGRLTPAHLRSRNLLEYRIISIYANTNQFVQSLMKSGIQVTRVHIHILAGHIHRAAVW